MGKKKKRPSNLIDSWIYYILIAALVIIPLVIKVRAYFFVSPIITESYFGTGLKGDVFSTNKYIFLVLFSGLLLILFIYRTLKNNKIKPDFIYIPVLLFAVLILMSSALSEYPSIALHGNFTRNEGAITYLCYLILFFISSSVAWNSKKIKTLLFSLSPFIVINSLLGLLNFYNIDISNLLSSLLISNNPALMATKQLSIYSTLNNPNYISGIGATLLIIFFVFSLISTNKKEQIFSVFLTILSFTMIITSLSSSGFVAFVLVLPAAMALLLYIKPVKEIINRLIIIIILLSLVFTILSSQNSQIWDETIKQIARIKDVTSINDGNNVSNNITSVSDNEFKIIPYKEPDFESNFKDASIEIRQYFWMKTIELIKERPFVGYGMDSLYYSINQDDPVFYSFNIFVDKPHNTYLNIAYGAGIPALLCYLVIIVIVIGRQLLYVINQNINKNSRVLAICLLSGVLIYAIQGIVNDSVIGSAVIFWVILGVSQGILKQN